MMDDHKRWIDMIPAVLIVFMAACSQTPPSQDAGAPPDPNAGPAAQPAPAAALTTLSTQGPEEHLSAVVAEVNGRPIYRAFYEQSLNFIRNRLSASKGGDNLERYLNAKFDALERIIDDELIYQQARKENVSAGEDEVRAELQAVVAGVGGETRFLTQMGQQGISQYDAVEGIRKRLTVNKYIHTKLTSGLTATDEEVLAWYNANLVRFIPEVWVKLFQITILCPRDASADRVGRARERGEKILANLRAGEAFEAMAKDFSEDRYAPIGGNVGFVKRGATYPEFDAVLFSMKPGEVSEVIRTDDGFHLLRVTEKRGGEPKSFEAVKEECRRAVLTQKQADVVRHVASELRRSATIATYLN
jgi:peptidyl-prolyl cis-trans isomerase C